MGLYVNGRVGLAAIKAGVDVNSSTIAETMRPTVCLEPVFCARVCYALMHCANVASGWEHSFVICAHRHRQATASGPERAPRSDRVVCGAELPFRARHRTAGVWMVVDWLGEGNGMGKGP